MGFPGKVQSWEPEIQGANWLSVKPLAPQFCYLRYGPNDPLYLLKMLWRNCLSHASYSPSLLCSYHDSRVQLRTQKWEKNMTRVSQCLKGKPAPQQAAWNTVCTHPAATPAGLRDGIRQGVAARRPGSWRAQRLLSVGNPSVRPTCERPRLRHDCMCSSPQSLQPSDGGDCSQENPGP